MRKDMAKVVVERPRYGGSYTKSGNKNTSLEDLPIKEGMRKPYGGRYYRKQFNDYLSPLRRFLESRVGKLWDDVYSEIRENINPNSTVQQHIMSHVFGYVDIHVQYIDGIPFSKPPYPRKIEGLYVDYEGYLRYADYEKRPKWKPKESYIEVNENQVLDKIDGIWYRVDVGYGKRAVVFENELGFDNLWRLRSQGYAKKYGPEIRKETIITKNIYTEMTSLVSQWKDNLRHLEGVAKQEVERKIRDTEYVLNEFKNVNERKEKKVTTIYKVGYNKQQLGSAELKKLGLKNG